MLKTKYIRLFQNATTARRMGFSGVLAAAMFLTAGVASAEFVAYTGQPNTLKEPPLQAYGGSLGMDFTVNSAINVDAMGVYDAAGNGVINGTLQVEIFEHNADNSWTPITATYAEFTSANPGTQDLVNDGPYDVYQAISPVLLDPGNYSVVAVGFSTQDPNGNTGDGSLGATEDNSGLLTYTGSSRYNTDENDALVFPTTVDGGPANRYDAGTFEFSEAPEPASFILIGIGLLLAAFVGRRRQKSLLKA